MDVHEILRKPSLQSARLIAGEKGLSRPVTGIMVLEAADIENWGSKGQAILTSYYALKDLSQAELMDFLEQLTKIGISALVIKLERFVTDVPEDIIRYCGRHNLPLIQIPKDVKYEFIILDVLGPIIDSNAAALNRHYEVHNKLTRMALKEPSLKQILEELKKMILYDVTLINHTRQKQLGTSPRLENFSILQKNPLPPTRYMNFQYKKAVIDYDLTTKKEVHFALSVNVPNLEQDDIELLIHNQDHALTSDDFMVIENIVSFLQTELLRQYSITQSSIQRTNNLVNNLLTGRTTDPADRESLLDALSISQYPCYQVITVQLQGKNAETAAGEAGPSRLFYGLKAAFKNNWSPSAYMETPDRISFIYNFSKKEELIKPQDLKKLLNTLSKSGELSGFHYQASLSPAGNSGEIPELSQNAAEVLKILHLFYPADWVLSYDDLGIYKIFLVTGNLEHLEQFIPQKLLDFRREQPELMETLCCFLEHGQNFSDTAAALYLHPKTIRYRVNKITGLLDFDFSDPEQLLQVQIAYRLFKLIGA